MARIFYKMGREALDRAAFDGAKLARLRDATLPPPGIHVMRVAEQNGFAGAILKGRGAQRVKVLGCTAPVDAEVKVEISYADPSLWILTDGRHAVKAGDEILTVDTPAGVQRWLKMKKVAADVMSARVLEPQKDARTRRRPASR